MMTSVVSNRGCVLLTHEPLFDSSNVDGLVFFRDHFYAVQSGVNWDNRFGLNRDRSRITGRSVFEQNSVRLNWPTAGVIDGNIFCFTADKQGDSNGGHAVVMKTDLDWWCTQASGGGPAVKGTELWDRDRKNG